MRMRFDANGRHELYDEVLERVKQDFCQKKTEEPAKSEQDTTWMETLSNGSFHDAEEYCEQQRLLRCSKNKKSKKI